jgi:hypothetical protein
MTRAAARESAKPVRSPSGAFWSWTADTAQGSVPANTNSRRVGRSSPLRLYSTTNPIQVHHSARKTPNAMPTPCQVGRSAMARAA